MIVAINTPAAQAVKKITKTVPVVMMRVADPVKSGLVNSLARPGENVTGLSFMPDALGPKGVELLHQILPKITRMAALYRGDNPGAVVIVDEVIRKAEPLGLKFVRAPVQSGSQDIARAFDLVDGAKSQALFVMDDGAITANRQEILHLAADRRMPVVSIYKDFAKSGGFIAYGPKLDIVYRRAAHFVDKLFKGEHAADLPVEQPAIFDVVVNLKTAKNARYCYSGNGTGRCRRGNRIDRAARHRGMSQMGQVRSIKATRSQSMHTHSVRYTILSREPRHELDQV